MSFENYTDSLLQAFILHSKQNEVLKRKKEILDEVANFYNYTPSSILYIGFNPLILVDTTQVKFVTEISETAQNYLLEAGIKFTYISKIALSNYSKKFDCIVAFDEYFTYASDDLEQKNKIAQVCDLAKEYIITTCRDYKNQDFKDREFSIPALIRNNNHDNIFIEYHDHFGSDKNIWRSNVYQISKNILTTNGPFNRRAMFFKQLAKFSYDAGSVGYSIHKNLMYKSLIKKNYEHVISIQFDNGS
jgi:hypothetical protein